MASTGPRIGYEACCSQQLIQPDIVIIRGIILTSDQRSGVLEREGYFVQPTIVCRGSNRATPMPPVSFWAGGVYDRRSVAGGLHRRRFALIDIESINPLFKRVFGNERVQLT